MYTHEVRQPLINGSVMAIFMYMMHRRIHPLQHLSKSHKDSLEVDYKSVQWSSLPIYFQATGLGDWPVVFSLHVRLAGESIQGMVLKVHHNTILVHSLPISQH